jgi:two-component system sensor histidine kinase KdpD
MVDLTPRALINRLERGVVYPTEKAHRALENFFRESTLVALRELALRQTAYEVENRQSEIGVDEEQLIDRPVSPEMPDTSRSREERILIHITDDPNTAMLVRRGKRVADHLHADCFAVAVHRSPDLTDLAGKEREAIERHLNFARNLHIETRLIVGANVAESLVDFARLNDVTQIFVNRPNQRPWLRFSGWNLVEDIVRLGRDMKITIVAERRRR